MYLQALTLFDYLIVAVVFGSGAIGLISGFVRESIRLLMWVIALAAAIHWSPHLAQYCTHSSWFAAYAYTPLVGFIISFIGITLLVLLVGKVFANFFRRLIAAVGLGWLDRLLGALFGLVRGGMLVFLMLFIAHHLGFDQHPVINQAQLTRPLATVQQSIRAMTPHWLLLVQADAENTKQIVSNTRVKKEGV